MWHEVARRIGCSVWRAKREVPAGEFHRWCLVIAQEKNKRTPEMWYYAAILSARFCTPSRVWGKPPTKAFEDMETFLRKFSDGEDRPPEEREKTEEELREEATARSKASGWGLFLREEREPGEKRELPPGITNGPPPEAAPMPPVPPVPDVLIPAKPKRQRPQVEIAPKKRP